MDRAIDFFYINWILNIYISLIHKQHHTINAQTKLSPITKTCYVDMVLSLKSFFSPVSDSQNCIKQYSERTSHISTYSWIRCLKCSVCTIPFMHHLMLVEKRKHFEKYIASWTVSWWLRCRLEKFPYVKGKFGYYVNFYTLLNCFWVTQLHNKRHKSRHALKLRTYWWHDINEA